MTYGGDSTPTQRRLMSAVLSLLVTLAALKTGIAAEPTPQDLTQRLELAERELYQVRSELAAVQNRSTQKPTGPVIVPPVEDGPSMDNAVQGSLPPDPVLADDARAAGATEVGQQLQALGATVEQLGEGMQEMQSGVEKLGKSLRVTTLREHSKIAVFGELRGEAMWSSARPIIPGAPLLLAPAPIADFDQDTFDIHAKSSLLGAAYQGPEICGWDTGGLLVAALFSETVVADRYGFLPLQAFGEIKNEDARFAAGLQLDVFNPVIPNMVNFNTIWASGNTGAYRGQMRMERFYRPSCDSQWTIQSAISEPLPTTIVDNRVLGPVLSEDAGLPNFEGRVAYALGPMVGEGSAKRRPFEIGTSGVIGQIRSTQLALDQVEADVWGVGVDARFEMTKWFGMQGEVFTGETLGTYLGGASQTVNTVTLEGIRASGAWGEIYYYLTPCVHTHYGYGIDDPDDDDLAAAQIELNKTFFGNVFWEVSKALRLGLEISYRDTDYLLLPDNDGVLIHTQMQWSF